MWNASSLQTNTLQYCLADCRLAKSIDKPDCKSMREYQIYFELFGLQKKKRSWQKTSRNISPLLINSLTFTATKKWKLQNHFGFRQTHLEKGGRNGDQVLRVERGELLESNVSKWSTIEIEEECFLFFGGAFAWRQHRYFGWKTKVRSFANRQ